jgi:hypothetical protein
MKWKKEFVEFVKKHNADLALATWQGSPFEDEKPKHPIELVNAKYADGWHCERFDEVVNDIIASLPRNHKDLYEYSEYKYYGKNRMGLNATVDNSIWGLLPFITKTEYLQITGREPLQRDWTGVIFKELHTNKIRQIECKLDNSKYIITSRPSEYQNDIDKYFDKGLWIEIKAEHITAKELIADPTYYTPNYLVDAISTIHVERPNTLEDRVKAIEEQLKQMTNGNWNADNIVC